MNNQRAILLLPGGEGCEQFHLMTFLPWGIESKTVPRPQTSSLPIADRKKPSDYQTGKCFYNNRLFRSYYTREDNGMPEGQLCYPHTTGSGLAFHGHYPRLFTRRLLSGHYAGEFWISCLESVRLHFAKGLRQLQTGYMFSYKEIKPSKEIISSNVYNILTT